jgi:Uma2 family endonuclease
MGWTEICENPLLRDLPYKVQTDKWGNIIMTPATNEHGIYQARIVTLISKLTEEGTLISECSIQTSEGVKVADVAWASSAFMQKNKGKNPFSEAPEVCIEILSPSNTKMEMEEKKELYFARGAKEFWICDKEGDITFYKNTGTLKNSEIIASFPSKVIL